MSSYYSAWWSIEKTIVKWVIWDKGWVIFMVYSVDRYCIVCMSWYMSGFMTGRRGCLALGTVSIVIGGAWWVVIREWQVIMVVSWYYHCCCCYLHCYHCCCCYLHCYHCCYCYLHCYHCCYCYLHFYHCCCYH